MHSEQQNRGIVTPLSRFMNNQDGEPRDTDQILGLIRNVNVPDMGRATQMKRAGRPGDYTTFCTPNVIGVDVETNAIKGSGIHAAHCGDRSQGLRQQDRCSTVQQAERLHRTRIHRHGAAQKILAHLGDDNTEPFYRCVVMQSIESFDIGLMKPDAHKIPLWDRVAALTEMLIASCLTWVD